MPAPRRGRNVAARLAPRALPAVPPSSSTYLSPRSPMVLIAARVPLRRRGATRAVHVVDDAHGPVRGVGREVDLEDVSDGHAVQPDRVARDEPAAESNASRRGTSCVKRLRPLAHHEDPDHDATRARSGRRCPTRNRRPTWRLERHQLSS